jgi:hypothetical protein
MSKNLVEQKFKEPHIKCIKGKRKIQGFLSKRLIFFGGAFKHNIGIGFGREKSRICPVTKLFYRYLLLLNNKSG